MGLHRGLDDARNTVYSIQMGPTVQASPRPNISGDLAAAVRQMIFDERLPAGGRINEVRLAAALGVSRTPLREALMSLTAEQALEIVPRRGFFVRPLTSEELKGLYPIRAILDPEALRLAGPLPRGRLRNLERLNERMRTSTGVESRISLDDEWHLALIAHCPNPVLIDLIRQFIRRTRRYELAYLRETEHTTTACRQHADVIAALRDGDLDRACDRLRLNLTSGEGPILEWLKKREE